LLNDVLHVAYSLFRAAHTRLALMAALILAAQNMFPMWLLQEAVP
jgi:hypothetical protein